MPFYTKPKRKFKSDFCRKFSRVSPAEPQSSQVSEIPLLSECNPGRPNGNSRMPSCNPRRPSRNPRRTSHNPCRPSRNPCSPSHNPRRSRRYRFHPSRNLYITIY
ncbi:hypothetical protein L3X38_042501 [Prunus dulcis]|uniref:Uncharacterized protein n=1 Tax=Prunus dulcis TaxID=3755 RepID=A0AAD4YKD1_PRUDU|nr:hypothetical protein L3X38_042501 [Prunus dulcis]